MTVLAVSVCWCGAFMCVCVYECVHVILVAKAWECGIKCTREPICMHASSLRCWLNVVAFECSTTLRWKGTKCCVSSDAIHLYPLHQRLMVCVLFSPVVTAVLLLLLSFALELASICLFVWWFFHTNGATVSVARRHWNVCVLHGNLCVCILAVPCDRCCVFNGTSMNGAETNRTSTTTLVGERSFF